MILIVSYCFCFAFDSVVLFVYFCLFLCFCLFIMTWYVFVCVWFVFECFLFAKPSQPGRSQAKPGQAKPNQDGVVFWPKQTLKGAAVYRGPSEGAFRGGGTIWSPDLSREQPHPRSHHTYTSYRVFPVWGPFPPNTGICIAHGSPCFPMPPHGSPWGLHGPPWLPMAPHGVPMGTPWVPMGCPGGPHGIPMGTHGHTWGPRGSPWVPIGPHGFMGSHGSPWVAMGLHQCFHLCGYCWERIKPRGPNTNETTRNLVQVHLEASKLDL